MRVTHQVSMIVVAILLVGGLIVGTQHLRAADRTAEQDTSEGSIDVKVGATFHGFWNYDSAEEMGAALGALKDAGGTWVRIDVGWAAVEPERSHLSTWALRRYDAAVDAAHRAGLNVLLVLQGTPSWANGSDDTTVAPRDVADFGDFAVQLANRYTGRVQAIELWNEPNHAEFFQARTAGQEAQEHAAMVKDAYTKIKASGPQGRNAVTVLAGGSSHVDIAWWEKLYAAGIQDYTDVVAVNPYPMPADLSPLEEPDGTPYRMQHLPELIDLMSRYDDASTPIWFTEFGWSDHSNAPGTEAWERGVSQTQQAQFLAQTLILVQTSYPQVQQVLWYNLRDRDDSDSPHSTNFGLLERDLTPKPVMTRLGELVGDG